MELTKEEEEFFMRTPVEEWGDVFKGKKLTEQQQCLVLIKLNAHQEKIIQLQDQIIENLEKFDEPKNKIEENNEEIIKMLKKLLKIKNLQIKELKSKRELDKLSNVPSI
jgi:hypothetical protein